MDIRGFLETVPFFAEALDPAQLDALAAGARTVAFAPGTRIIHEDDPGGAMFVVASGALAVTLADGSQDAPVATLTTGQIFGEMALLTGLPRLGTVTAEDRVEAVEITRQTMQPILAAAPRLYDRFAGLLQKRQGDLDQILDPSFWESHGRSRESLAKVMRRHFDKAD
jgi:CRP-like cAMP-binding protein